MSPVLFKNVEITGLLSSNEISHGLPSKQGYSGQREERGLEPLLLPLPLLRTVLENLHGAQLENHWVRTILEGGQGGSL